MVIDGLSCHDAGLAMSSGTCLERPPYAHATAGMRARFQPDGASASFPRDRHVDASDESVKLLDVVAQEIGGRSVGHFAVVGDQTRRELDVRFDGVHLRRIAEAEDALQMLLGDGRPDLPR